jgi:hypothetical protein
MTVTEKMVEANRRNARKSTGPRTSDGKAVVARNALKHGLAAKELVIPGERKADLVALRDGLFADLRPVGELEAILVDRIALAMWRLRRAVRFESGYLENKIYEVARRDEGDLYGMAVSWGGGTTFERLQSIAGYEAGIERGMFKALRQLRELQEARKKEEAEVIEVENVS